MMFILLIINKSQAFCSLLLREVEKLQWINEHKSEARQ